MSPRSDHRTSERIPIRNRVKVMAKGRMVAYTLAINISMGGVLLDAGPSLPVGSRCELAIFNTGAASSARIMAEGVVVRTEANRTAVQFLESLPQESLRALTDRTRLSTWHSVIGAYSDYFRAGQSESLDACERLLGVSRSTYRAVFYTSFATCIPLAILPVWLLRASIPPAPVWAKIALCFLYGGVWLLLIQPTIDLTAFRLIRARKSPGSSL